MHNSRVARIAGMLSASVAHAFMNINFSAVETDERLLNADGIRGDPKPKKKNRATRHYYTRVRERDKDIASKYHSEQAIAAAIRRGIRWSRRNGGDYTKAPQHIWEKIHLAHEVLA